MKQINWIRKLTSRKLWASVASFVSMMIVATGGTENTATQVTALIMAGASIVAYVVGEVAASDNSFSSLFSSIVAYVVGEGLTDAANITTQTDIEVDKFEE